MLLTDIVQDTQGTLWHGDRTCRVSGVSIDSRATQAGNLFIALRGERFDGHQFVAEALRQGAGAVLVSDTSGLAEGFRVATQPLPAAVLVPDTLVALHQLATAHRRRFQGTVIAITGSNGKTTVKEMTAAVLQTRYHTFKAYGNLNNHIGLPLTLLRMELAHDVAVFELGMNHLGEIRQLSAIVQPHIGVITNIGLAHVGYLGSIAGIQQAKGELIAALPASGVAVLNADDPRALALGNCAAGRVLTFGQSAVADVSGQLREDRGCDGLRCDFRVAGGHWPVTLATPGAHNIMNALAAAAVGTILQVPAADMVAGLQGYHGVYGRLAVRSGRGAVTLLDDTYNANPNSMRAALQFLGHLPTVGRRLAVLGDMLELGPAAPALHREVGAQVAAIRVAHLIALGTFAPDVAHGACAAGMAASHIHVAIDQQEVLALLEQLREPGDVILLKGSRGMAMEHLVQALAVDEGGH